MAKDQSWIADLLAGSGGGGTTTNTEPYTQPAVGSTVSVTMADATLAVKGNGVNVGPNTYVVTAEPIANVAILRNTGGENNVLSGVTVGAGAIVTAGSVQPTDTTNIPLTGQAVVSKNGVLTYQGVKTVCNALSFAGVDPTGNSDSWQGFTNAMAFAVANALTLYIPKGYYQVGQPLVVPGSLVIEGDELVFTAGVFQPIINSSYPVSYWGGGHVGPAFWVHPPTAANPVEYQLENGFYWAKTGGLATNGNKPIMYLSESQFADLNGMTALTLEYVINCHTAPAATVFPWCGGGKTTNSSLTSALKVQFNGTGPFGMNVSLTTAGGILTANTGATAFALDTDYAVAITYDGTYLKIFAGPPGGAPTITATSSAGSGAIVQNHWESFILGASQGPGQWPFGITDQTGQMRWGNLRKSKVARTITTMPSTEFVAADVDSNTDLLISFAPAYRIGPTGIMASCGDPQDVRFGVIVAPPANVSMLWRNVFNIGTDSGPTVTFRNLSFTGPGDCISVDCSVGATFENLNVTGKRCITLQDNCFYPSFNNIQLYAISAGSSQSWGIGLMSTSGVAILDNIRFVIAGGTAAIALHGSDACTINNMQVNTCIGFYALFVNAGVATIRIQNSGFGDEAGTGVKEAFVLFDSLLNAVWDGGGTASFNSGTSTAAIFIDGGVSYRFNIDMATTSSSASALIKGIALPAQPVVLESSYQGQGLESAYPWTDGTIPVKVKPLEDSGRTVWDATGSGTITCQWYTSADSSGTPIAQGASGGPTGPDFSCRTIVITDSGSHLTGTTAVVAPTFFAGYRRRVVAPSTQAITFGGSTGAVVTIAAGKSAEVESNGAGWERVTADV